MGLIDEFIVGVEGFEWDVGNSDKNWHRHAVRQVEAEQILLSRPLVVIADVKHSHDKPRFIALGRTDAGRHLMVVFTVRGNRIRVISARPMSKVEQEAHAQSQAQAEGDA